MYAEGRTSDLPDALFALDTLGGINQAFFFRLGDGNTGGFENNGLDPFFPRTFPDGFYTFLKRQGIDCKNLFGPNAIASQLSDVFSKTVKQK